MPKSKHRSSSPRQRSMPTKLGAESINSIVLPLQNALTMIELGHGNEENWHTLAAGICLGQELAATRRDPTAVDVMDLAAINLNNVADRHRRIGGRWGATADEVTEMGNGLIMLRALCSLANSRQAIPAIERVVGMQIGQLDKLVRTLTIQSQATPGDQ